MGPDEPAGRTLEAVEKAFDVVETLWEMEGAGVTAVAEALGLPKSTVHAHLRTLESNGYVVNDGGEYRLGLRFLTFGQFVRRAEPLFHAARQPVDDLAKRTGERVLCMTEQNGLGMVLYVGEGSRSLFGEVTVGTSIYHHCSAGGKAMMAHYPRERVDAIVERWGLPAFTDETITDRETLLDELATVREEGIAFNREEYLRGVLAVGVPVFDATESVCGAVTLAGPVRRLYSEREPEALHDALLATANTIEVNLVVADGRST
jgi:DNA-binding IclR family transcriptional regulator